MPAEPLPSLEDLARTAWAAWGRLGPSRQGAEWATFCLSMKNLGARLDDHGPPPTRALDYMLPIRLQCELRFACALIDAEEWPVDDKYAQAIIDKARRLARLLLDGPDAR